jgi:hypothetical protein
MSQLCSPVGTIYISIPSCLYLPTYCSDRRCMPPRENASQKYSGRYCTGAIWRSQHLEFISSQNEHQQLRVDPFLQNLPNSASELSLKCEDLPVCDIEGHYFAVGEHANLWRGHLGPSQSSRSNLAQLRTINVVVKRIRLGHGAIEAQPEQMHCMKEVGGLAERGVTFAQQLITIIHLASPPVHPIHPAIFPSKYWMRVWTDRGPWTPAWFGLAILSLRQHDQLPEEKPREGK